MKKIFFLIALFLCVSDVYGKAKDKAADKAKSPLWMTDAGRLQMFPSEEYLSAFAFGGSPDVAKTKAAEQLSEYIKSHITSSVNYSLNDDASSLKADSSVQTDNVLYTTEYTTPFLSDYHGMFCVVAYIERNKAFNYVKPKLESGAKAFEIAYQSALLESGDFEKVMALNRACGALHEFYEVYDFARAVNPSAASKYASVDEKAKLAANELKQLKSKVVIRIKASGDTDVRFKAALSALLSETGFSVSGAEGVLKSEDGEEYLCTLKTELDNGQKTEQAYEIFPSYSVEIRNNAGVRFSVARKLQKVTGFDKVGAERRAKLVVESDIKIELKKEFE